MKTERVLWLVVAAILLSGVLFGLPSEVVRSVLCAAAAVHFAREAVDSRRSPGDRAISKAVLVVLVFLGANELWLLSRSGT
jgi:hypothetical protein